MSDNFLSAEKPKSETDSGWIEYALLLGWEELPVGYEYVTDNAKDELATLRAQLEEAKDVISQMYFAITPNKHATLALLEAQRRAYQYLDSVKSGD